MQFKSTRWSKITGLDWAVWVYKDTFLLFTSLALYYLNTNIDFFFFWIYLFLAMSFPFSVHPFTFYADKMWASLIPNSTTFLILIEQIIQSNVECAILYINILHDCIGWQNHSLHSHFAY